MRSVIDFLTMIVDAFNTLIQRRSQTGTSPSQTEPTAATQPETTTGAQTATTVDTQTEGTVEPGTETTMDGVVGIPAETQAGAGLTLDGELAGTGSEPVVDSGSTADGTPVLTPNVLVVIFNPRVTAQENKPLTSALSWSDPDELIAGFIADVEEASHGVVSYQVADRVEFTRFPAKVDGFCYDAESYLACRNGQAFHQPDAVDYAAILRDADVIARVNSRAIDEVWLFGMPFAGFAESAIAGPGAYFCNGDPVSVQEPCARRFFIMGFNFERGVGEMLEAMGHRAEDMLRRAYRGKTGDANLWERFIRTEQSHPGQAEVGTVHLPPNAERDYDWANARKVHSRCDTWYAFPDLRGTARLVDYTEWGGNVRAHHKWWMRHFPHIAGQNSGVLCNWWRYVLDPNLLD